MGKIAIRQEVTARLAKDHGVYVGVRWWLLEVTGTSLPLDIAVGGFSILSQTEICFASKPKQVIQPSWEKNDTDFELAFKSGL